MSAKAKRLFKKLVSYSGIFFFILAAGMLWWQLREYSFSDTGDSTDLPGRGVYRVFFWVPGIVTV